MDSIKEALPKISMYNDIIAGYVEEINLKYGITLNFTNLKADEIGHWAKMLQVAKGNDSQPEPHQPQQLPQNPQQPEQPKPQASQLQQLQQLPLPAVVTMPPQAQTQLLRDQQVEIGCPAWLLNGQQGNHVGLTTHLPTLIDSGLHITALHQTCPQSPSITTGNTGTRTIKDGRDTALIEDPSFTLDR